MSDRSDRSPAPEMKDRQRVLAKLGLSSAGEFHPRALQEPYVTVSCHTAPTVQPTAESQIPRTQRVQVHGVQFDPTSGSL